MKRIVIAVLFIVCMSSIAAAQTTSGFAFFAPGQLRGGGGSATFLHFGGGAKYITSSRVGFGGELGLLGPKQNFSDLYGGEFSANAYYVLRTKTDRLLPFLTAGYTRTFGHESGANMFNFGFGVDYWFKERMGGFVEFRDHVRRVETGTAAFSQKITFNLWEIRLGLTFK